MELKTGDFGYIVDNNYRPTKVKIVQKSEDLYVVQRIGISGILTVSKREVFSTEEDARAYKENNI